MTRIIAAVLLVAVLVLGWRNQVLELRNAELGSALAIARRDDPAKKNGCAAMIDFTRSGGEYTAVLQMATRLFEENRPHFARRSDD